MKKRYLKMLHWALNNEKDRDLSVGAFALTIAVLLSFRDAFIPEMKRLGARYQLVLQHLAWKNRSRWKWKPCAWSCGCRVSSRRYPVSAAASRPPTRRGRERIDPHRGLKPRSEWPVRLVAGRYQDAMRDKLKALPGVQIVMAQPISDRVTKW